MKLSEKLIELRKGKGWSQEDFAEKLDVSRQAISRWENGTALPDAHNIVRISKLFNVTADYLLNDEYDGEIEFSATESTQEETKPLSRKNKSRYWYLIPTICFAILTACAIAFIIIIINTHTHSELYSVKENEVAPSCTAEGAYDEVVYCADCDEEILRISKSLAKLTHTLSNSVKENEIAATCTAKGSYDEVVYCKKCNEAVVRTSRRTDMIDHQFQNKKCVACGKAEPSEGLLYMSNGNKTCFVSCGDCTDENIVIPDYSPNGEKVTQIKSYAFAGNKNVKSVQIPETVTDIGEGAFEGCINLESVNLPSKITIIQSYTFKECENLKEITIPAGVYFIGMEAFADCHACQSILIPANVTKIGPNAFRNFSDFKGTVTFERYDGWRLYDDSDNWVDIVDFQNGMATPMMYLALLRCEYFWKRVE